MGIITLALTWNGPEFDLPLSPILTLNLKINLLKPSLFLFVNRNNNGNNNANFLGFM